MNILAFDASSVSCSVCVSANGITVAESYMRSGLTHSATLLPSVEGVLKKAGLAMPDIDEVCLTVGPGSFTGVKIGVATAKGLCFAGNIPVVGVSTMEALAYNAEVNDGLVCPVLDARRNMFYNALFLFRNGGMTRLCPDRQVSFDDLVSEIKDRPVTVIGDGAALFAGKCAENGVTVNVPDEKRVYIQAESIVRAVSAGCGTKTTPDALVPLYLRPSQAERERAERLKKEQEK